jgi:hypothetical protein
MEANMKNPKDMTAGELLKAEKITYVKQSALFEAIDRTDLDCDAPLSTWYALEDARPDIKAYHKAWDEYLAIRQEMDRRYQYHGSYKKIKNR